MIRKFTARGMTKPVWAARRGKSRKGKVPAPHQPCRIWPAWAVGDGALPARPAPLMRLALLLLLAACAVQPMTIPPELRSCAPPATPGPLPLGRRVTTEQLRAHDAAERSARRAAEAALIACADRLIQLNELVSVGEMTPASVAVLWRAEETRKTPPLGTATGLWC